MTKNYSEFERLVYAFTVIAYLGAGIVFTGVIAGTFLQGVARVCVICIGLGSGGLAFWVGLRERKKGKKILAELSEERNQRRAL